jgi:hypothetical protein
MTYTVVNKESGIKMSKAEVVDEREDGHTWLSYAIFCYKLLWVHGLQHAYKSISAYRWWMQSGSGAAEVLPEPRRNLVLFYVRLIKAREAIFQCMRTTSSP